MNESGDDTAASSLTRILSYWPVIVAALTATWYVSGLTYYTAFLMPFGADRVLTDLSPTHLIAAGAVSSAAVVLPWALAASLLVLGLLWYQGRRVDAHPIAAQPPEHRTSWVRNIGFVASAAYVIIILLIPLFWLAPRAFFEVIDPLHGHLSFLFVIAVGFYLLAALTLSRRSNLVFHLAALIAVLPGASGYYGEVEATRTIHDRWSSPRVVVWTSEGSAPVEWSVLLKDGDRLLLFRNISTVLSNTTAWVHQTEFVDLTAVNRAVFVSRWANPTSVYVREA